MQIDIIGFLSDFTSFTLVICLTLWAVARVLEVWLNVYERSKKESKE